MGLNKTNYIIPYLQYGIWQMQKVGSYNDTRMQTELLCSLTLLFFYFIHKNQVSFSFGKMAIVVYFRFFRNSQTFADVQDLIRGSNA